MAPPKPAYPQENDKRHRCCCGRLHVKTAAILVAIVELLIIIGYVALSAKDYSGEKIEIQPGSHYNPVVTLVVIAIWGTLQTVTFCVMFYGICATNERFLMPQLIVQVVSILLAVTFAVMFSIYASRGREDGGSHFWYFVGAATLSICVVAFYIWFFFLIYYNYRYLKDVRLFYADTAKSGVQEQIPLKEPVVGKKEVDQDRKLP